MANELNSQEPANVSVCNLHDPRIKPSLLQTISQEIDVVSNCVTCSSCSLETIEALKGTAVSCLPSDSVASFPLVSQSVKRLTAQSEK